MLKKFKDLKPGTQRMIARVFVHWHYDTTSATFADWASKKAFYVCKDGTLDARYNHCEPEYLAD